MLALTPQAVVPTDHVFGEGPDSDDVRHRVIVREVFRESAEAALATGIAALLPLVSTMQPRDGDHAALLTRIVERILALGLGKGTADHDAGTGRSPGDAALAARDRP